MDQRLFLKELTDLMPMVYRISRSFNQDLASDDLLNLPPSQIYTLLALQKQGVMNMTQLAAHQLITRQQLTKIIDALVEKKLVKRKDNPANRRHVLIQLTEQGSRFMEHIIFSKPSNISRILGSLVEDDAQRFLKAIVTIKEVLAKLDASLP